MEQQIRDNLSYHYTSLETITNIIDNLKEDKIILHASSIFHLNDPSEMKFGYEKIMELLPKIEDDLGVKDDNLRLSRLWDKDPRYTYKTWRELHLKNMCEYLQHVFTVSLSRNRDSLAMWTRYGDNGFGVALGLDTRIYSIKKQNIQDFTHIDFNTIKSIDVNYGNIPEMSIPYFLSNKEYRDYWDKVQRLTDNDQIAHMQMKALTEMMMFAAPFVKNNAYVDERESRIIKRHECINDIQFKIKRNHTIVPYIEVDIPISNLREIILGPCCDFDMVKSCIEIKLRQKGIENMVDIVRSEIPYRG